MLRTIEAVIEPDGNVRLLEPVTLTTAHRALVTVLEEAGGGEAGGNIAALVSEPARAEWRQPAESAAWGHPAAGEAHIQGVPGKDLLRFAGTISPEDLDVMERVIEGECERIDTDGW